MLQLLPLIFAATLAFAGEPMTTGDGAKSAPQFEPLPSKAVGVVVLDSAPLAAREGRSGPPGAVAFLRGTASFRWMYLPAPGDPDAEDMSFGLGPDGKTQKLFSKVRLATKDMLKQLELTGPFHLVEVEVNGGDGSPAEESFVATSLQRLDGTKEYPFKPAELLRDLTARARKHVEEEKEAIAKAMAIAQEKVAKGRKPTGPEEKTEEVLVTWLPKEARLRVEVQCRVTNGFYVTGQGVEGPKRTVTRGGTQFGAVGGMVYEVGKNGEVERETPVKFVPFTRELGLPQGANRP
jgi:hypothetical protein